MKKTINRLVLGLSIEAITLCLILSFTLINIAATITLLIFNLFFLPLTIHLNGKPHTKLGILAVGNITGLLWNFILHHFAIAGNAFFGNPFNLAYTVSYPFLNFMWVVAFWSLSLTVLSKPISNQTKVKT